MFFDLPPNKTADIQFFTHPSTVINTQWHTWIKPPGVKMVAMMVLGGGGGGAGGVSGLSSTNRAGGGGGASGNRNFALIPAFLLPDVLYIQVGAGGLAGGPDASGASGVQSYVSVAPNTTSTNQVLRSDGGGGGSLGGAGGNAAGVNSISNMPLVGLGMYYGGQGVNGGAAASGVAGTDLTIPVTGTCAMGGSGGGGATNAAGDTAAGGVTAIASSFISEMMPAKPAAGSNNGSGGANMFAPFYSLPALGGSGSGAGTGGDGGNGVYSGGGGGGGAGVTAGRGGVGGTGVIAIVAW